MPSPTPMACTGRPNRSASATSTPPLGGAVELGHDQAGDVGHRLEDLDLRHGRSGRWWRRAPAGRRAAPSGSSLRMTRSDLVAARPSGRLLFCRRPAVSISSTSAPSCLGARASASKARPAASRLLGGAERPARRRARPRSCSCSTAAARKVSPAASITVLPSRRSAGRACRWSWSCREPLTPTTSTTCGLRAAIDDQRLGDRRQDLGDLGRARPRAPRRRRCPCRSGPCARAARRAAPRWPGRDRRRSAAPPAPPASRGRACAW